MTSWIEYTHLFNNFRDLTEQNNLMITISTQALYNPHIKLETAYRFPLHFHSPGYTSYLGISLSLRLMLIEFQLTRAFNYYSAIDIKGIKSILHLSI